MADSFASVAARIRAVGEPRPYGTLLRQAAHSSVIVCESCGVLESEGPGDWIFMCHDAMDHVSETGHQVAVEQTAAVIYGPKEAAGA